MSEYKCTLERDGLTIAHRHKHIANEILTLFVISDNTIIFPFIYRVEISEEEKKKKRRNNTQPNILRCSFHNTKRELFPLFVFLHYFFFCFNIYILINIIGSKLCFVAININSSNCVFFCLFSLLHTFLSHDVQR